MRILHYYPKDDAMISQHVAMLTEGMGLEAENFSATEVDDARTLLKGGHYDILHLHGCWRNSSRTIVALALRQGTRLVLTPHGQLQPWVQEEHRWKEKLPKRLLYQRDIVQKAYAVIIQGKMEQECMERLEWNRRTVIIRNAVITSSISKQEMARQTFTLYRKVMDSNPWELMDDDMHTMLRNVITAGITGDRRWLVTDDRLPAVIQWRLLLCYAHQEHISDVIERGLRVLGIDAPDIDTTKIEYFLPDDYKHAELVGHVIGNQFASENERLIATFRQIRKFTSNNQLGIMHLVELDRELRQHSCNEEQLNEELKERRLWKSASRMMQLMAHFTGLTEGFMPVVPTSDRTTKALRRQIENHLKIKD